jgi:hypothetical protein
LERFSFDSNEIENLFPNQSKKVACARHHSIDGFRCEKVRLVENDDELLNGDLNACFDTGGSQSWLAVAEDIAGKLNPVLSAHFKKS